MKLAKKQNKTKQRTTGPSLTDKQTTKRGDKWTFCPSTIQMFSRKYHLIPTKCWPKNVASNKSFYLSNFIRNSTKQSNSFSLVSIVIKHRRCVTTVKNLGFEGLIINVFVYEWDSHEKSVEFFFSCAIFSLLESETMATFLEINTRALNQIKWIKCTHAIASF